MDDGLACCPGGLGSIPVCLKHLKIVYGLFRCKNSSKITAESRCSELFCSSVFTGAANFYIIALNLSSDKLSSSLISEFFNCFDSRRQFFG